ncbi:hypothetical protein HNY73_011102 [Argiope bruennichi]|uniref:Uncharacterized protein n=1 Tax=Argiope bruennichi TaxID=94029 RepID=A0A8T0F330_ARGBR|nr:hypothetical protein HNY73_011102 [Argiope bruennichi]
MTEITQAISLKETLGNLDPSSLCIKDRCRAQPSQEGDCSVCEMVKNKENPSTTSNNVKNAKENKSKNTPNHKLDQSEKTKNSNVVSPNGSTVKESKKRFADADGFIAPAAHLIRKVKNLKIDKENINDEIKIKEHPEGIKEVVLDDEVDADQPPAQQKRRTVPPFSVTPRADFRVMLNILKLEAPSLRSVMSSIFLKLTVETEEEHR